ncbi:penicillin-binding transpeptidase domain-containing protein [Brevibacterium sp. 68QC2CO]|nr:penicillin-binding transpeptidase domain-containing protein [Brevibacterium sp. 68QC2CO]
MAPQSRNPGNRSDRSRGGRAGAQRPKAGSDRQRTGQAGDARSARQTSTGAAGTPSRATSRGRGAPSKQRSSGSKAAGRKAPAQQAPKRPAGPRRPAPVRAPADPRRRVLWILIAVLCILALLTWKLFTIQGMDTAALAQKALASRLSVKPIPAHRGVILGSDGRVLADNADRYRLVADQVNVKGYEKKNRDAKGKVVSTEPLGAWGAAKALAGPLQTDAGILYKRLDGDRRWSPIADGLTSEVWNRIDALHIPGLTVEQYSVRTYPDGALAGNIVGFVGSDGAPLAGLELQYRDMLAGVDGEQRYERGRSGDEIPLGENQNVPAVDGTGVRTTLNLPIQYYAQKAIAQAVKERQAEWGTVTMFEAKTGRIIAAAEAPSVDPNNPGRVGSDDRGSRIFNASFEPGSTAKMVTAAALLEEGKVTPETRFTVPYKWKAPNDEEFKDSHEHKTEKLTFAGIMMDSSNTGTVMAGQQLSEQQRYDYLHRFGFGTKSALAFPGQASGILRKPSAWDGRTKYTVLFGQGVASTSLQNAEVIATIANGGKKMVPQLVSGTVDDDGKVTEIAPKVESQVISEKSADSLMRILESVVADGTGEAGKIPGYRVAGKTGTAQAPTEDGSGYKGYTASFAGAVPAEDPQLAVSVTLQRPKKGYYGGTAAAPVFSDVAGYALRQLGVPPSTSKPELPKRKWK